jgi:hypothetical protein
MVSPGPDKCLRSYVLSFSAVSSQPISKSIDISCIGCVYFMKVDHDDALQILCRNKEKAAISFSWIVWNN